MEKKTIEEAKLVVRRIKHFLIANLGRIEHEASTHEFYYALCMALRDKMMTNWISNLHSISEKKRRILYYLSMEYLPGKFLKNNITNIGADELIKHVLNITNRNLKDILDIEPDPGLGNGGLGRLASCYLDSLATQKYPAMGYGLRYQYGIFDQEIWNGNQVERPDCWLLEENPWQFRKDLHAISVKFRGTPITGTNSHGNTVFQLEDYEEVRAIPYDTPIVGYSKKKDFSIISMRLWTTKESPRNFELQRYNAGQLDQAGENTSLTDVLYPNDHHDTGKRIRLKQEFLLVSASIQDIIRHHFGIYGDLSSFADKVRIQINDTHPAMIIAELCRRLNKNHDIPWQEAWEITRHVCSFTNHTVLTESLEEWNEQRVANLLPRQYNTIEKLNFEFCQKVRAKYPNDEEKIKRMSIIENGQIKMSHLAIYGSHKVNGVSSIHSEILKNDTFKDFYEMYPEKFINITNGVTQRRWLLNCNPYLAKYISEILSDRWLIDFKELKKLKNFANDKQVLEKILEIKQLNKEALLDFLSKENPIRDKHGKIIAHSDILGVDALFDIQIKRIHEYKRQLMNALHLIMLYHELKKDPNSRKINRQVIIGGKSAPGYERAKQIITLLFCISRKISSDSKVKKKLKVDLVENYNVSKAEIIIPAADLSEQISTAGTEASGTGNMKLSINGALTIGTDDGANIEMKEKIGEDNWPFSFGLSAKEIETIREKNSYNPKDIYLKNSKIKKAVDALKDGSLVESEAEHQALYTLYESLMSGDYGRGADYYFVLKDLETYYETQKKVEEIYSKPHLWAKYVINNIAGMGYFSSDVSINNYVKKIWELEKCEIDKAIFEKIDKEYSENK